MRRVSWHRTFAAARAEAQRLNGDARMAEALLAALEGEDEQAMLEAENDILEHLDVAAESTEQGLTRDVVLRIEAFVSEQVGRPWTYQDAGYLGVDSEGAQR